MKILFSFKTTLILLAILAIGAGYATFIENDFGVSSARVLVYNNIWYEFILVLTAVNLLGMIFKHKMYKTPAKFMFHIAFVVILVGAGITRYIGYEGIMNIPEGTTQNKMISLEPYLQVTIEDNNGKYFQEFQKEFTTKWKFINYFHHTILFNKNSLDIEYLNFILAKKDDARMGLLEVKVTVSGKSKTIKLPGRRSQQGMARTLEFDGVKVTLEYGSKVMKIPFSIKLNDFQLDRYPGSNSPSSYASEITVFPVNAKPYDYRIFMNTTLEEGGFLFFQSSYFQDEKGTILSVNNDPGKWPTYIGYFLLILGLLLNFFDKKSRFTKLTKMVASKNLALLFLALISINQPIQANTSEYKEMNITKYQESFAKGSLLTATKFSRLLGQTHDGRIQPLSTLNKNIIQKISKKSSFFGMNYDQISLGMLSRPDLWRDMKIVKIRTPKLKKFLEVNKSDKYIAFSDVIKNETYVLNEKSQKAMLKLPTNRGTYEKDILQIDERLNILYSVFTGNIFKIFPKIDDAHDHENLDKWLSPLDAMQKFHDKDQKMVNIMIKLFLSSVVKEDWKKANKALDFIATFQKKIASDVIPSQNKIDSEIWFNEVDVFLKLTLAYIFIGFIMMVLAFMTIFKPNIKAKIMTTIFFSILASLFAIHTFGMGFRWFLSGHAPWSDTYETLLYISWSAVFAGIIFFRKSLLALSSAVIIAAIFMFTAHLTGIDPQITNLVPVLKSYWLTIHVSIITASYGFFGLGSILGLMNLMLFIFVKGRPHVARSISNIRDINEIALIVGISFLTIGNFLGGIWANESWGRYWGWDPKETWAYVAIVIYAIVLHLRLIKNLNTAFVFSVASLLAFSTILMTYFGVNFYLSGLHSYASGDPVPIPTWVYYVLTLVFITIALAYRNRNLK